MGSFRLAAICVFSFAPAQFQAAASDYLIGHECCAAFNHETPGGGVHVIDWQTIVAQHGPQVWRTVYRMVSHREDALDCYQETFLQAAKFASNNSVSNWHAFLVRIATGRAMDCLRRRYRMADKTAPLDAVAGYAVRVPSPAAQAELHEAMDRLRQALAELPPQQAEVFWLREVESMTTTEVAEQIGITSFQAATWLHRAKRKLRAALTEDGCTSEVQR